METHQLLIVAGEASGDLHAARLLERLHATRLDITAFGMGGEQLTRTGFEQTCDYSDISVVGIREVLKVVRRAKVLFARLLEEVDRRQARTAVLVDFPEFNLRMAKALSKRGVKVIYYISPQLWAWRKGRISIVRTYVDRMLVLFPFEVDFYRSHHVDVTHVGHPLVDEVPVQNHVWDSKLGTTDPYRISLLPGSRSSELATLLPILIEAATAIARHVPVRFSLIRARSLSDQRLAAALEGHDLDLEIVDENRFSALWQSHLALCASGTATLETGLCETPMIVVYKIGWATYLMGKALVRLPFASLVNLLLEEEVVPELLQRSCTPDIISSRALAMLRDREGIQETRRSLAHLRQILGSSGASERAATAIAAEIPSSQQDP